MKRQFYAQFTDFHTAGWVLSGGFADHHGGDQDGKARHHKGMFKQADQDGDGAVSTEEHEQASGANGRQAPRAFLENGQPMVMVLSLKTKPVRRSRSSREKMKEKRQQKDN